MTKEEFKLALDQVLEDFGYTKFGAQRVRQGIYILEQQLAASQLREQQLRNALGICLQEIQSWSDEVGYERFNHTEVNNALALPGITLKDIT